MNLSNQHLLAQPGIPDPDFGIDGSMTVGNIVNDPEFVVSHLFKGMTSDSEGKTIFSALLYRNDHFVYALGRLKDNGHLDRTFADNGLNFGSFIDNVDAGGGKLAVQKNENSKIIMQGWTLGSATDGWADLVVACFDKNGKTDPDFADQGRLIIKTPSHLELHEDSTSLYIQADNKILVTANYSQRNNPNHTTGVLLRILPDGQLDTELNGTGRWEFKLADPNASTALSACVSQGQNVVLAGHVQFKPSLDTAVFVRLKANGQLDPGFGDPALPGFHVVKVDNRTTQFNAMVERSDGSLVGAGAVSATGEPVTQGLLVAITPNGVPHQLFNGGKPLITQFDTTRDNGWASALMQADDKLVVASKVNWVFIARFTATGQPDTGFNGKGYTELGSEMRTEPVQLSSRVDGRIIVSANTLGVSPDGIGQARCYFS